MLGSEERREIAYQLRQARLRAGLTVGAVASKAGLDRTTISTYEARRAVASEAAIGRWILALFALVREGKAGVQIALNELTPIVDRAA